MRDTELKELEEECQKNYLEFAKALFEEAKTAVQKKENYTQRDTEIISHATVVGKFVCGQNCNFSPGLTSESQKQEERYTEEKAKELQKIYEKVIRGERITF